MESKSAHRCAYFAALVADQKRETAAQVKVLPLKVTYRVAVVAKGDGEKKRLFADLSGIPVGSIGDAPCQLFSTLAPLSGPDKQLHLCETRFLETPDAASRHPDFDLFLAVESEASPLAGLARCFPASRLILIQRDREGRYRCSKREPARNGAAKEVVDWLTSRLGMTVDREPTPGGKENEGTEKGKKDKTRKARSPFANIGSVKQ